MQPNLKVYKSVNSVEMITRTQKRVLVIIKNEVYDLTNFAASHPGGSQILWDNTGKVVDDLFEKYHRSSESVKRQLAKYKVGIIQKDP
jgi:Cytochrome b involved in lipid metabolism